jgi:hypothetical protein
VPISLSQDIDLGLQLKEVAGLNCRQQLVMAFAEDFEF